jgi:hypothetical protein
MLRSTSSGAGLQTFQFGPLAIPVDPLKQYLLSLSAVFDGVQGSGAMPQRGDDPLPNGQFVISNDGLFWFTATTTSGVHDLAFIAEFAGEFAAVPEPSFRVLLAVGCLVCLVGGRHRRHWA